MGKTIVRVGSNGDVIEFPRKPARPPAKVRREKINEARDAFKAIARTEELARRRCRAALRRRDVSIRELAHALKVPPATLHRFVSKDTSS